MISVVATMGFNEKEHRTDQEDRLFPRLTEKETGKSVRVVYDRVGGNPCGGHA